MHSLRFNSLRRSRSRSAQDTAAAALDAASIPIPSSPVLIPARAADVAPKHREMLELGEDFKGTLMSELERLGFGAAPLASLTEGRIFPMDDVARPDGEGATCSSLLRLEKLGERKRHGDCLETVESYQPLVVDHDEPDDENLGPGDLKDATLLQVGWPLPDTPIEDAVKSLTTEPSASGLAGHSSKVEAAWTKFGNGFIGVFAFDEIVQEAKIQKDIIQTAGDDDYTNLESGPATVDSLHKIRSLSQLGMLGLLLELELEDTIQSIVTLDDMECLGVIKEDEDYEYAPPCSKCLHCLTSIRRHGIDTGGDDCTPLLQLFPRSDADISAGESFQDSDRLPSSLVGCAASSDEDEAFSKVANPTFTAELTGGVTITCSSTTEHSDANESPSSTATSDRLLFPLQNESQRFTFETDRHQNDVPRKGEVALAEDTTALCHKQSCTCGPEHQPMNEMEKLDSTADQDGVCVPYRMEKLTKHNSTITSCHNPPEFTTNQSNPGCLDSSATVRLNGEDNQVE